ncbi:hypothetical protein HG530_010680 [Fusarium avenaceum]|nr:hypothetical protein HG530_010680 [Fusarium avenaceum]
MSAVGSDDDGTFFFYQKEPVHIAEIAALVILTVNNAQRRANFLKRLAEVELAESANARGAEDEVGACIDNSARATLEEDKVDVGAGEGVSCCETNRAASNNDSFEALRGHVLV